MSGWVILAILVALALLAPWFGADTRTGDSWTAGDGLRGGGLRPDAVPRYQVPR